MGQLNVLLVLCCTRMPLVLAQTASSSKCLVHQLWNQGIAVTPVNFYFNLCCFICDVFRREIRFGVMLALPIL